MAFQKFDTYPVQSGSIFFYTYDAKFLLKTISGPEVQQLLDMLPAYHRHLTSCMDKTIGAINYLR